jgi:integrase
MARKVKDKRLDSREQRLKLKVTGKPYYRAVERSVHLGYRRLKGAAGTWCARYYKGDGAYEVEAIGIADDMSDADGVAVLDFWQAQGRARERMVERAHAAIGKTGPITVADVVDDYIQHLQSEGRPASTVADVRYRDGAFIRGRLGNIKAADLTADILRKWRDALVEAPARVRTRAGEAQKHRETTDQRARRASANRTWTTLRAALNYAFHTDKIASDKAWKKVKPFGSVDHARVRYLSIAEAKRLINAADREFRPLLQAALLTGGRYGQLAALVASDFNADAGTVTMRTRKGSGSVKTYHVHLTAEGVKFFKAVCANRRGDDLIFTRADGGEWRKSNQEGPIAAASVRSNIDPPANFHITRHTWASHAVMNGTPLMVVAQNLGHRDTRMVEKHYGHLAPSYVADAVRAGAPAFDIELDTNLASLDDQRARA